MKELILFALLGTAVAVTGSVFAIPATDPAPRYNFKHAAWWFGRFDRLKKQAAEDGPSFKVVFLGDSITEHWESAGKEVWKRTFDGPRYKAINCGFGGDRTENLLWRIRNGQLDGLDPQAVVLLIGTNNTFSRPVREEPPGDTVRAVSEIVAEVRARCPSARIVLNAILPQGEAPDGEKRLRDARINEQLPALADGEHVLWMDFGSRLLTDDGRLTKEIAPDFTHPSEKGYEIWAAALTPVLDWCLGYSDVRPAEEGVLPDAGPSVWRSADFRAKRDEVASCAGHYYDYVVLGGETGSRVPAVEGYGFLDFPLGSGFSGEDVLWAVENGGLCDGYCARVVVVSPDMASSGGVVQKASDRLLAAIRTRQPQARIVNGIDADFASVLKEVVGK